MKKLLRLICSAVLSAAIVLTNAIPGFAYTVQPGDTLGQIAKTYNVSVDDLIEWNNIHDKDRIYPGQELKVQKEFTSNNPALTSEEIQILYSMFDAEYYAKENADVVAEKGNSEAALFEHFLEFGLSELRQPNANFNVAAYAAAYDDLSAAFGTDVVKYYRHLYEFGKTEKRAVTTMEDLAATGVDIEAFKEQQRTFTSENGRPQFSAFYEEDVKTFVLPQLPEPELEPEPEPVKALKISEIAATLKVIPTKNNPWVNENGYKGYWDADQKCFYVANEDFSETHSTDMTDSYVLVGNDYVFEGKLAQWTCIMKDGAFSAFKLVAKADSHKPFAGTYEVPIVKYTVSFDLNGQEGTAPDSQKVAENSVVAEPLAPTAEGYVFGGWFVDTACLTAWNFASDAVTADTVLYAKWTAKAPENVTVTFNTDGGTTINPVTVKAGESVTKPADPAKTGYVFDGWYSNTECTTTYDFASTVERDITVYAKWTEYINKYTVSFNLNLPSGVTATGFSAPSPITNVVENTGINEPIEKNNDLYYYGISDDGFYTFGTWYKEKECINAWDFANDKVTADTTLYASWMDSRLFKAAYKEGEDYGWTLLLYYGQCPEGYTDFNNPVMPLNATYYDHPYFDEIDYYQIGTIIIDDSLKFFKGLNSTSYMFYDLEYVENYEGFENLNVARVTDMGHMFEYASSNYYAYKQVTLKKAPDVSNWDTSSVTSMYSMFSEFGSYIGYRDDGYFADIPDTGNWDTSSVTTMENMFCDFAYYTPQFNMVPDVSKWNTQNVESMEAMFCSYGYSSSTLSLVPDVGDWKTDKLTQAKWLFDNYGSSSEVLNEVPDISNDGESWNTSLVTDASGMFNCYGYSSTSLNKIPDIGSWDMSSMEYFGFAFWGYGMASTSIKDVVLDLSNLDAPNLTDVETLFESTGIRKVKFSDKLSFNFADLTWGYGDYSDGNNTYTISTDADFEILDDLIANLNGGTITITNLSPVEDN